MESLEKKLGYCFRDRTLLAEALNHSSYANEHRGGVASNERLEFLGDSVLGFVTAEFLFKAHGSLPEGDLTRMRAALVCEQSLYEVAKGLELGAYLKLGKGEEAGGGRARQSILADATEAVLAAVYLDGGMEEVRGHHPPGAAQPGLRRGGAPGLQDHPPGAGPAPQRPGAHLPYDRGERPGPQQDLPL